ncbi:MAG: biopolymer transporter ExbD [Desulfuromonadales bacterium]|nr:biopolymer transporter ExbD [Desulfuromonadales bacterium]
MSFLRRRREEPRLELTPMIDVVFLLLIFFMISTTFVETPGITIKLPESSAEAMEKEPQEIKIYLSREGEIWIGDERLSQEELQVRLTGYGSQAQEMTFLLLADREALHGRVVQLMDLAREAGFGKLAIATEERKRP